MRKNVPALDSLFPSVRQGVLAATLTRPDKWWYLSELAQFLHTRPSSLQRELISLEQSGILQQRKDGRRTYFKAETRSPIFRELRSIFEKTVGLIPTLRVALRSFDNKIICAFVYGSIARREEGATRSEEHTSELQSRLHLVCRLLLEKKKIKAHSAAAVT